MFKRKKPNQAPADHDQPYFNRLPQVESSLTRTEAWALGIMATLAVATGVKVVSENQAVLNHPITQITGEATLGAALELDNFTENFGIDLLPDTTEYDTQDWINHIAEDQRLSNDRFSQAACPVLREDKNC